MVCGAPPRFRGRRRRADSHAAGAIVPPHQGSCRAAARTIKNSASGGPGLGPHQDRQMSDTSMRAKPAGEPAVAVVVPVRNEAGNIAPLVDEIAAALGERWPFEVVYVNDGSTDGTEQELVALMRERPWLRQVKHAVSSGQSCAVRTGVASAHA